MNFKAWNLVNPIQGNYLFKIREIQKNGVERYGTVVKTGTMKKTIHVRVDYFFYNSKYNHYYSRNSKYLVHDEENFCVPGDKVIIRRCQNLTKQKYYYVRNIVKPAGRNNYYK